MSFQISNNSSGEISSRGINKAFGMQKYLEHAGIARENTIAFGDGTNDIEMLKYAHIGVAMGNAVETLKKQANYVTSGVDEGWYKATERYENFLHTRGEEHRMLFLNLMFQKITKQQKLKR